MAGGRVTQSSARKRVLAPHHTFAPSRSVDVIDERGMNNLPPSSISANTVGCKAVGLCAIPAEWTRRYFIVSSQCFSDQVERSKISGWISAGLSRTGTTAERFVMIRSSGTRETLRDRGSLVSKLCKASDVVATIEELRSAIDAAASGSVHWIVQDAIVPRRKGHFS